MTPAFSLTITIGLPGSGKTTWAKEEAARTGAELVSRDDIRRMLRVNWPHGDAALENIVSLIQKETLEILLNTGRSVILHNTTLDDKVLKYLCDIGEAYGAEIKIKDFRDVPLTTCIDRDGKRPEKERVGGEVIMRMWARYLEPRV